MPELSVILVNYNDRRHLEGCLVALIEAAQDVEAEIVVVDNASSDGSPELVRRCFPQVRLVENSENVGFARACNQGLALTDGRFVLFLNTDATVNADSLNLLLEELRSDLLIGGVGPALKTGKDSYQVSFGKRINFFAALIQKAFYNPYFTRRLRSDRKRREVGWLSAACLLTRRSALEEAGFFDEHFFLYFEDIDLCYRLRERNWKLIFQPQAKVTHVGGVSTEPLKSLCRYHYRKSQIYFYSKHNSRISLFFLRLYLLLLFAFLFLWKGSGRKAGEVDLRRFYQLLKKGPG